jgi:hypothetical protein
MQEDPCACSATYSSGGQWSDAEEKDALLGVGDDVMSEREEV